MIRKFRRKTARVYLSVVLKNLAVSPLVLSSIYTRSYFRPLSRLRSRLLISFPLLVSVPLSQQIQNKFRIVQKFVVDGGKCN